MTKETIRDIQGRPLGYIEHADNGDAVARNISGTPLARYTKADGLTRDISGRTICYGNAVAAAIIKIKQ